MCSDEDASIRGSGHLAGGRARLEQKLIFGPEPNAHPTAHCPTPDRLECVATHPADALNCQVDEPLQECGFGQLLSIRERAEMRLRIRCDPGSDELRGSHGCQVFNNSRREAILHITLNSTNTPLSKIPTRTFRPPRITISMIAALHIAAGKDLEPAASSSSIPTRRCAPALAIPTAKTDASGLLQSIAANICGASACIKANSRSQ